MIKIIIFQYWKIQRWFQGEWLEVVDISSTRTRTVTEQTMMTIWKLSAIAFKTIAILLRQFVHMRLSYFYQWCLKSLFSEINIKIFLIYFILTRKFLIIILQIKGKPHSCSRCKRKIYRVIMTRYFRTRDKNNNSQFFHIILSDVW